jgi:hypothetical protein
MTRLACEVRKNFPKSSRSKSKNKKDEKSSVDRQRDLLDEKREEYKEIL